MDSLIKKRKSSRLYDSNKKVPIEILEDVLNAARWAPSSSNIQPWRYMVFTSEDKETLEKAQSLLGRGNQAWANAAPVLILSIAMVEREDGSEYPVGYHDLGLANENLMLQAVAHGLNVRPMGGFNKEEAIRVFSIPNNFRPVAMLSLGYPGNIDDVDQATRSKEGSPRTRKGFSEIVFTGKWEEEFNFH